MTRVASLLLLFVVAVICAAVAVPVALAAERFPDFAGPIVLFGILLAGLPLGVVGGRMLVGRRKTEFRSRLQASQRTFCVACGVSSLGMFLSAFGTGILGGIGAVVTAGGLCLFAWIIFRATPGGPSNTKEQPSRPV